MKPYSLKKALAAAVVVFTALSAVAQAAPISLTGAVQYSADTAGVPSGYVWNTLGGDSLYNLYLREGGPAGPYVNTGDTNPSARIDFELTPGTHTFIILGEPGGTDTRVGLNLFFDGDDVNPGISATAAQNANIFNAKTLDSLALDGTTTASSGSLTYSSGIYAITLTDYMWMSPSALPLGDYVSAFDNISSGASDLWGTFTLEVTQTIPEPATLGLLAVGGLALLRRR